MKFTRPLADYKGYKLCDPCWNNHHWHKEIITAKDGSEKRGTKIIQDCLGPPLDHSLSMDIDMTDPIQIGIPNPHKDE